MNGTKILDIELDQDITVVSFMISSISGMSGIEQVSADLRNYIDEHQPQKLVIDFSQVKFISSQMLGLLVHSWRKLNEYGGKMLISGINPQLNRVFRITNLDKIFDFYQDKQAAVSNLKREG